MATNTDTEGDAQQRTDETATVARSALGEVYEAACREYDARNELHLLPDQEADDLLTALEAVKSALDEADDQPEATVDRSALGDVYEAACVEFDKMVDTMLLDEEPIESLRESLEAVESVLYDDVDQSETTTSDKTVEELIELWQEGEIGLEDADSIDQPQYDGIELKFDGSDGVLILHYSLSEELTYRSDTDNATTFNILTADTDQ